MYILVANDLELSLSLHFVEDFELSDCYYYDTLDNYLKALDLFLYTILN